MAVPGHSTNLYSINGVKTPWSNNSIFIDNSQSLRWVNAREPCVYFWKRRNA